MKKFVAKSLAQLAEEIKLNCNFVTGSDAIDIVNLWWSAFEGDGAKASWKNTRLYWHSFSFGCMPSMSSAAAFKAFAAESVKQPVFVFSGERRPTVLKLVKHEVSNAVLDKLIANNKSIIDLYVVDCHFAWTFVRTHEECTGLGPYYSKSDWLPSATIKPAKLPSGLVTPSRCRE